MEAARALVSSGPTADEIAAAAFFGFQPEDFERPPVAVWPCCLTAVELFCALLTQWRMGYAGPIGLDYAAIPVVMRYRGVPATDRREIFEDLQVMESAAVDAIAEARQARTH